jgi:hypothetical protein
MVDITGIEHLTKSLNKQFVKACAIDNNINTI